MQIREWKVWEKDILQQQAAAHGICYDYIGGKMGGAGNRSKRVIF